MRIYYSIFYYFWQCLKRNTTKNLFFSYSFFIFWQAINNRTSRANISDVLYPKKTSSGRARAWPEYELDPSMSLTRVQAWPKHEFDPSTSLTQVKRSKPSIGSVSIEYYTSLYTYYLGSWYSSWYSVVSIHLHQKYVYITVL